MLKELALNAPTFFFQQVQPFFENISNTVRDPKVSDSGRTSLTIVHLCQELYLQSLFIHDHVKLLYLN